MFASLYIDGVPTDLVEDAPDTVALDFDSSATYRCRVCCEELVKTVNGYESESGDTTSCEDGQHEPERMPLSWCNSAAITVDECDDSVTVSISVGDPRGAFTFTIRRVPDDVPGDLAGRLVMHTPYAGQPCPHMALTPIHDGTYVVGP